MIKRPYGTIKGQINTPLTKDTTQKHKSDIRVYQSKDTEKTIDWQDLKDNPREDNLHEELLKMKSLNDITKDDGTYEIYVVPGKYDVLIDKSRIFRSYICIENSTRRSNS